MISRRDHHLETLLALVDRAWECKEKYKDLPPHAAFWQQRYDFLIEVLREHLSSVDLIVVVVPESTTIDLSAFESITRSA